MSAGAGSNAPKHLRASATLDPAHKKVTYMEEQRAHALLVGKVAAQGAFPPVG
jgi:hypothetical protein